MRKLLDGRLPQPVPLLTVLVALAVVIGLIPPAARYGETNGLIPTAQRLAQAAAERRQLAAAQEEADMAAADLDDDAFTETIIEFAAPAAGPGTDDAPADAPATAPVTDATAIDLAAASADSGSLSDEIAGLLAAAPLQDGWFPAAYRPADETFVFPDEVDMLKQLHIARALQQAGLPTADWAGHVKALFDRDGKLYTAYDSASSQPATDAESPVVYRLAFEYALAAREHEWAAALRTRLQQRDLPEPESP